MSSQQVLAEQIADWAKKLTDCESAKSSEIECSVRFEADYNRLEEHSKAVTEQ